MKFLRILLLPLLSILLVYENQALEKYYSSYLGANSIGKRTEKTDTRVSNLSNQGARTKVKIKDPVSSTNYEQISKRVPEVLSGEISEGGFLNCAEKYLGKGYKEVSPGRYLSKDGLRQVRYGAHETTGKIHHAHFEAYDKVGGTVVENARVIINPTK